MDILEKIKNGIFFLDGAMGTMLQNKGLKLGENPEILNITDPSIIEEIHTAYFQAGSQMVLTNTFGANAHKMASTGYSVETIITAAVANAKKAAKAHKGFVGLDVGPLGELLEPMGALSFDDAYTLFKEQITAGAEAGVDAIYIETMTDLYEMKAAVLAAKENCALPVFATMSFEETARTFTGCSLSAMALTLTGLGVDALGINCSLGPKEILPMAKELPRYTHLPIIIKPNAGLPEIRDSKTVFNITQDEFVIAMKEIVDYGATIIGGCCGTTSGYIQALQALKNNAPSQRPKTIGVPALCTPAETVPIDDVRIIGERINPTGKKRFQEALIKKDLSYIVKQGIIQVEAGAQLLDVNVGLPEIDEADLMAQVVKKLQSVLNTPLQIDSSNIQAIEAGLRYYNGVPIVNSVNGEEKVLQTILPLVKKYGACVVGLTLDENGIPPKAQDRFLIAKKIMDTAVKIGIPKQNVFIDTLTLTASAEQETAYETLLALRKVKEELGLKTVLGVSNISFGLPAREKLNSAFLSLALAHGLDMPIINPNIEEMMDTVYCFRQLKNLDAGSHQYISRFSGQTKTMPEKETGQTSGDIAQSIFMGLKDETIANCQKLLMQKDSMEIVNTILIPALDAVGSRYEKGEIFLPQLIQSAEAAKEAFELIRSHLRKTGAENSVSQGKILMATVKGDIHDIGKNIVKVVLENYGYDVLDLGRDVAVEKVVNAAVENNIPLIGLSALMTTTVKSMEETIRALKSNGHPCQVFVGGAVLTQDYADQIGADFYAKDAQASVSIAKQVFGRQ